MATDLTALVASLTQTVDSSGALVAALTRAAESFAELCDNTSQAIDVVTREAEESLRQAEERAGRRASRHP